MAQQAPAHPKPTRRMQSAAAAAFMPGPSAQPAPGLPGELTAAFGGGGAAQAGDAVGGAGSLDAGGFDQLLASVLATPSSGALMIAGAKAPPANPNPPATSAKPLAPFRPPMLWTGDAAPAGPILPAAPSPPGLGSADPQDLNSVADAQDPTPPRGKASPSDAAMPPPPQAMADAALSLATLQVLAVASPPAVSVPAPSTPQIPDRRAEAPVAPAAIQNAAHAVGLPAAPGPGALWPSLDADPPAPAPAAITAEGERPALAASARVRSASQQPATPVASAPVGAGARRVAPDPTSAAPPPPAPLAEPGRPGAYAAASPAPAPSPQQWFSSTALAAAPASNTVPPGAMSALPSTSPLQTATEPGTQAPADPGATRPDLAWSAASSERLDASATLPPTFEPRPVMVQAPILPAPQQAPASGPQLTTASEDLPPEPAPPPTSETIMAAGVAAASASSPRVSTSSREPPAETPAAPTLGSASSDLPTALTVAVAASTADAHDEPGQVRTRHDADDGPAAASPSSTPQTSTPDPSAAGLAPAAAPGMAAQPSAPARPNADTVPRLAAEIVQNAKAKASHFQVELMPAGLGRVGIDVRIGADGTLSAALNFDTPQAAEALKAHAGELREALQQAGFNLSGSDLSFTAGGSGQQPGQGQGGHPSALPVYAVASGSEAPAPPPAANPFATASSSDGLDIRI